MTTRIYNLEERLINFAVVIIQLADKLPKSFAGNHLMNQIIRSGSSPALNYGEAIAAESRNDFIHKMKIVLKELRETNKCLKIISKLNWLDKESLDPTLRECNELISIFVKSIETAKQNKQITK
jgi:four helix bundle protein